MREMSISEVLKCDEYEIQINVKGWVRTRRDTKHSFCFVELNDGSCGRNLQIIIDDQVCSMKELEKISTGACMKVVGLLKNVIGREHSHELLASEVTVLGVSDSNFPIQKKKHTLEYLRSIPHLRVRTNLFSSVFRVRHSISMAIHKFFDDNNFFWIHTPCITTLDCEGAGDMFKVTTFNLDEVPKNGGKVDYNRDFFKKPVFLTVSGQLALESFSSCYCGVYTFGPTFRAENSNTPRHLSEFWMVEPEIAFADLNDDYNLASKFLKFVISYVLENNSEDMEFFDQRVSLGIINTLKHVVETPFELISYSEAIDILSRNKELFKFPVYWGCNLYAEHERFLTEKCFRKPVAVINYPKALKPFYMYVNDDEKTVAAMDILVPGIGELMGGSQREHRKDVLMSRMVECGLPIQEYDWYLDLRKWGTVPHSGFGIGLERAVQYITGISNIRDVIPFPRTPKSALY